MKKKRIMLIGPKKSGKSYIAAKLNDCEGSLRKAADIIYGKNTIYVPSAYIENTWMYSQVIAVSQDAACILVIVDKKQKNDEYSFGFAKVFNKDTYGVITNADYEEDETRVIAKLKYIGAAEPYFRIEQNLGSGIEELKSYLFSKYKL